jgi:hypothetical protein
MGPKTPHTPGSFNFELSILKLLKSISGLLSGTITVTTTSIPSTATPALSRVTVAGTVAAGKKSVSIMNTGATNATVLGAVLKPTESVSFGTSLQGETLAAIAYNPQSSELLISTLT